MQTTEDEEPLGEGCPLVTPYTTAIGIPEDLLQKIHTLRSWRIPEDGDIPFKWPSRLRRTIWDVGQQRDSGIPLDPRQYQLQMAQCLSRMPRIINGDSVGLGKTLESIISCTWLAERFPNFKVIVICTKSTSGQWSDEFQRFSTLRPWVMADKHKGLKSYAARFAQLEEFLTGKEHDVLICKYSSMIGQRRKMSGRFDEEGNPLAQGRERISPEIRRFLQILKPHGGDVLMILDECQKFKGIGNAIRNMVQILARPCARVIAMSATVVKNDLAQPLTARVRGVNGWTTIGDLQKGDVINDPDGGLSHVVDVFPRGPLPVYKVTTKDGRSTESSLDHLWLVQSPKDRISGNYKLLHTEDMLKTGLRRQDNGAYRFFLPRTQPFELSKKELLIAPYIMGALLGDGSFRHRLFFASWDHPILQRIRAELPPPLKLKSLTHKHHFAITGRHGNVKGQRTAEGRNPFRDHLKHLGLWGMKSPTKFIPQLYLEGSIQQRLDLLRGLMDTDGTCTKRTSIPAFDTTSPQLVSGISELVESLGGFVIVKTNIPRNTQVRICKATNCVTPKVSYRVYIKIGLNPFHLSRKAALWRPSNLARAIKSIEPTGKVEEMRCIQTSSERSLYFTDGGIPTHNTEFYSIASAIGIRPFGGMAEFHDDFCIFRDVFVGRGRYKKVLQGYRNVAKFKAGMRPFFFGRSQRQVKEPLPKLTTLIHPVDLNETQQRLLLEDIPSGAYPLPPSAIRVAGELILRERDPENLMTLLSVYQLVANHPALLDPSDKTALFAPALSPKEEMLLDFLDGDYRGESVLVYTKSKSWIDRLEHLTKAGKFTERKFLRITGAESEKERNTAKALFQDPDSGYDLIVINAAATEGVNLQQAAHMVLLDLPWSWGDLLQLVGRMVRMASPNSACTLHIFAARGSVDEYAIETLKGKKGLFEKILGESHSAGLLDDRELFDLTSGMEQVGTDSQFLDMLRAHAKSIGLTSFLAGEQLTEAVSNKDYKMAFEPGAKKRKKKRRDDDYDFQQEIDRW